MLLSIIIPVFNEEKNIPVLYQRLSTLVETHGYACEIIIVNDGSTDRTPELLNAIAEQDRQVKVIHFGRNFGQTSAMMAGIEFSKGDVLIPMDGDLQNDPNDIPKLLETLAQGYDVCSGWRKNRMDNFMTRTFPSRVANRLISWMFGVRLHDYGCTLKAYKRDVVKSIRLYGEMHRLIPIYAAWCGARVTEVPVNHSPRPHGKSNYGFERTVKLVLDLIVTKFFDRYAQKPIYVFGGFGLLSILSSFLFFGLMVYYKFFEDITFIQTPLPLLVVLTFLMGFMSILIGLIAEFIMRTYFEAQGKHTFFITDSRNISVCSDGDRTRKSHTVYSDSRSFRVGSDPNGKDC